MNEITNELIAKYPLPRRLFGCSEDEYGSNEWIRRRLFANIIVGGSRDLMAVKGAELLFERYTFDYLADRENYAELRRAVADMLEDECEIRFAGKKADYILNTAYKLQEEHDGVVPNDDKLLQSFPGVGRHASAVVRGLAFGENTFAVDLHVRRIAKRMGLVDEKATDRAIEKVFSPLEGSTNLSRAFVDFGASICTYHPKCNACPFSNIGCNRKLK